MKLFCSILFQFLFPMKMLPNDIHHAEELFANPDVDGGLIGGAALKVVDFKGIIDAFK